MKRIISIFICLIVSISTLSTTSMAATTDDLPITQDEIIISETIEKLDDDNYLVITVSQTLNKTRAANTVSGTKTYSGRNGDGEILWQFKVHGTFSVNPGVSSVCTDVSHSYNLPSSNWNYVSGNSYKSGNKAIGHGKFNRKILLIVVETRECDVTLSCDVNGKLS